MTTELEKMIIEFPKNEPVTKDEKLGINVRLGLKHLQNLDEAPLLVIS